MRNFIYFVQVNEGGPIKIGRSVNVIKRFSALRGSHSASLKLLATLYSRYTPDVFVSTRVGEVFSGKRINTDKENKE
jgi:hypothetical protein